MQSRCDRTGLCPFSDKHVSVKMSLPLIPSDGHNWGPKHCPPRRRLRLRETRTACPIPGPRTPEATHTHTPAPGCRSREAPPSSVCLFLPLSPCAHGQQGCDSSWRPSGPAPQVNHSWTSVVPQQAPLRPRLGPPCQESSGGQPAGRCPAVPLGVHTAT